MSLPELLAETVGDETVVASVPLGGDDRLAVTPTRTLVYRGDGLLSDESVAEYGHDVERIDLSTGRRKAKLTLGYGLDGDETLSIPTKRADDVLHPILAGVLAASGVTDPGESVVRTFRFSELTLVVTSDRLVKHVGSAVWDDDFEEFPYADLTDLDFEEGTVATAVVLAHGGRSERFKAPNESARAVRETLVDAVCDFHDVESLEEFRVAVAADAEGDEAGDTESTGSSPTDFGEGPDPLSASPAADAEAEAGADAEAEAGADAKAVEAEAEADADTAATGEPEPTAEAQADATAGLAAESDPLSAGAGDPDPSADHSVDADSATAPSKAPADVDPIGAAGDDAAIDTAGDPNPTTATRGEAPTSGEPAARGGSGAADETAPASDETEPAHDDAFTGSPFETAGVEGEDLATEVAELRHTVEAQSERLDRQSTLIEQLIEELRRGR